MRGGEGACMAGGLVCVAAGGGPAWQEERPLQRAIRILLECILVFHCVRMFNLNYVSWSFCFLFSRNGSKFPPKGPGSLQSVSCVIISIIAIRNSK